MNGARYRPVLAKQLREGHVVLYHDSEHLVVAVHRTKTPGRVMVLQHLTSKRKHETKQDPNAVFMRRDEATMAKLGEWKPVLGEVVVYHYAQVSMWQVAVRQSDDWATSACPRHHALDLKVVSDVNFGCAVLVHTPGEVHPQADDWIRRTGSVVTTHESVEPSAWVRVEPNLWRSTTGVQASDAMIRFEMERGTYHLVSHVEET